MIHAKKILHWTPILLMVLLVGNHVYLRYSANLSPWLGAGFGMFSTTDSVSARQVFIYGLDTNGFGQLLDIPDELAHQAKRTLAIPSSSMLKRMIESMHGHLVKLDCHDNAGCTFTKYRIEVWRANYHPETLLPEGERLASLAYKYPAHE